MSIELPNGHSRARSRGASSAAQNPCLPPAERRITIAPPTQIVRTHGTLPWIYRQVASILPQKPPRRTLRMPKGAMVVDRMILSKRDDWARLEALLASTKGRDSASRLEEL